MSKPLCVKMVYAILSTCVLLITASDNLIAQLPISDFTIYSGPNGTGTTLIGSSITINGGSVGAKKLVQTTGNATINSNIYSGDKIIITNSNVINGRIAAANSSGSTGTILSVGSSTYISGNIDVNGNIVIGGGTVSGTVTLPVGKSYTGPVPAGDTVFGPPSLPVLPDMPAPTPFPAMTTGLPGITNSQTVRAGSYGNVIYSGNKTLTLDSAGIYYFYGFQLTGNSNKLIFNFKNGPGVFYVYIYGNADFGKLNASLANGGNASRVYTETHGNGAGTSIPGNSFIIANGSSGGGSKWQGTVYAPFSGINIGSGTGSSTLTGALHSANSVTIQSGVTLEYAAFSSCSPPDVNAGPDRPLDFTTETQLNGTSATSGVSFGWQAINGGIITSDPNVANIKILTAGTYILTVSTSPTCVAKDTVIVSSRTTNLIGAELLSIYRSYTDPNAPPPPPSQFFQIQNGYVLIDVIVNQGYYNSVLSLLQTAPYGLIPPFGLNYFPDGQSTFKITGMYPIINLLKLNQLFVEINHVTIYYQPLSNSGLITTAGDTTMRSHFVRSGYNINGNNIRIGVISNSYATIPNGTTATLPLQPVTIPPNPIPQTFNTNTFLQDIANGDLPGDTLGIVNPNGFLKNVHVIQDFPVQRSDEGRAMLQVIHDVAPASELYFRTGFFTEEDYVVAINQLRLAGCNIIVDDVQYATEPFLKDGIIANAVNTAVSQGVSYFSAAGNFDKQSYEKNFNPLDITALGFAGKKAHNFGGGDVFQKVRLAPGNYLFVCQWTDNTYSIGEGGTMNDLDIYLTPNTNGTSLIGYNRDNTNGNPIEFIPITITGTDSVDYNIFIVNNTTASNPDRVKYVVFRGSIRIMEYNEGNSTLVGHANSLGAIAIGAARFNHVPGHPLLPSALSGITKPQIETFSSTGGTFANGVQRLKPDLAGPDGGNTTVRAGQDYPNEALDGYSNFFGTSAAAPHAAAAAALVMEGRKKFLAGHPETSPSEIKSLLQATAVNMRPAGLIGYDFASGAGLIDADSAMRTFAAPTPFQIQLIVPTNVIPGESEFLLKVTGQNFSNNSVIYIGDSAIETTFISKTELNATIGEFEGNPEIRAYTAPKTDFGDGGFSNSLFFFDGDIVVQAVSITKKYGDPMPALDTIITINGTLLQDTTLTLADIGLTSLLLQTTATASSNVGTYLIDVNRTFDINNADDLVFLKKYNYEFIDGTVTIGKLPVKVVPDDKTIVYGQAIGNVTYKYYKENNQLVTDAFLLNKLDSSHNEFLADNVLGVLSGYANSSLTDADLLNMSGMVSFHAVNNSRKFQVVNGAYVPLPPNTIDFNTHYLVDVSAHSIVNYKNDPETAIFEPSYPGVHDRAIVGAGPLVTGDAHTTVNGQLVQLVNGQLVQMVNTPTGTRVPITNGLLVQMVNGVLVQMVNGVPVPVQNAQLVQLVNGQLVQLVNGQLVQLVNGQLVQLVNGTLVQMVNGQLVQLVNGQNQPVINGQFVQVVNGQLVQLVNGQFVQVVNGQLVQMVNGQLVQLVNGVLVQMVNGTQIPINNGLVQVVNGQLVQLVNGQFVQMVNGTLVQLVNGQLVQLVNSYTAGSGDNEDAAVIIDSDDLAVQNGFIGAMFSTNVITGLNVGQQTLISGALLNSNFSVTYGLGHVTITPNEACLLTHTPFKNFGNTTLQPTSLWLNLVTKVSGQLTAPGDYLMFKSATVTFNFISSTPLVNDLPIPDGKIVADNSVSTPVTNYDAATNTWITRVPVGYASTSDIFVTGAIINSSNGFIKLNGNTNSVVKGMFYSNKNFSDQWAYAIAAYQPQFTYADIGAAGNVSSINGDYRAGTPIPVITTLVQGASGGGGNNYTGSKSAFDNYTACIEITPSRIQSPATGMITMETVSDPSNPVPDVQKPAVMVYPNPASDLLTVSIRSAEQGSTKIELFTFNGSRVLEKNTGELEKGGTRVIRLDLQNLAAGTYLLRVWNGNMITNKKVVITR